MKAIVIFWGVLCGLMVGAEPFTVGNFTFKPGENWVVAPKSPMVKAALNHGKKDGPLLKFYHFGQGQGGGVKANVTRWQRQFQNGVAEVAPEDKVIGGQKVTIVTMTGTYMVGPMMARNKTATPDYMLLGAIIPHPSGDVFLKMTGPEADLTKVKEDFDRLVASALAKAEKE